MPILTPRDVLMGSPPNDSHGPITSEFVALLDRIEAQMAGGIKAYEDTKAQLDLITGASGDIGFVLDDGANSGVYQSNGTIWTKTSELPTGWESVVAGAIDNAKLSDVATATIKGRATAATGTPEDLTAAQVITLLGLTTLATSADADDLSDGAANVAMLLTERTKLSGIATSADVTPAFATSAESVAGLSKTAVSNPFGVAAHVEEVLRTENQNSDFRDIKGVIGGAFLPGMYPDGFAVSPVGLSTVLPEVKFPVQVGSTADGKVLEWFGSGAVALDGITPVKLCPRGIMDMTGGRKWAVNFRFRRATDTTDPAGDAVLLGIQWLNSSLQVTGLTVTESVLQTFSALTAADGWQTVRFDIAQAAAAGIDASNTEAVYARAWIKQLGSSDSATGPKIQVLRVGHTDISNSLTADAVGVDHEARITVLEAVDIYGTTALATSYDLNTITGVGDYYVTSPVNGPTGGATLLLVEMRVVDANTAIMRAWDQAGANDLFFWRKKVGGTWGNWQTAATEAYVDAADAAITAAMIVPTYGTIVPTFEFATPGDFASGTYETQAGVWSRIGRQIHGSMTLALTPTWTTSAGLVYISPQFLDSGASDISASMLPYFDGGSGSVATVFDNVEWPIPSGALEFGGSIDGTSSGRVKCNVITAVSSVSTKSNMGASQFTSGNRLAVNVEFSYLLSA